MKVLPEDFAKLFNERHFNILYQASTTDYQSLMSEEEFVTYANDFKNNSGDFELKFHNSIHYKVDRYCFIDDNDTHMITAVFHQNGEIGGIQFDFHEQYETDDDYTKNEYYKNIVNLGKDAVPVLEDMYNKGKLTGVNAYLSALVIQDITKCNLNEKYNLDWSTAEEFYDLWKDNNCSYKK